MRTLATALLLLGAAGPAMAQEARTSYESVWLVQPDARQVGRRTVADDALVLRSRLLPPTLIRVTEDATDARSGRVLAAAGTQLFGLQSDGAPIFCAVDVPRVTVARALLLGSGNRQRCFIDGDRDGRLDGQFTAGNAVKGLPNIRGRVPRRPDAVAGGRYVTIEPGEMQVDYWIGLEFHGGTNLVAGRPVETFRIAFGTDDNRERLSDTILPDGRTTPPMVRALGAEIAILGRQGNGVDLEVRRGFAAQPFGVRMEVNYR